MTPLAKAAILAIGSELLTPTRIDTNSLFITDRLNAIGIDVVMKGIIGDDRDALATAVDAILPRVDLLVCCGGLGPTDDDVTREAVAQALGRELFPDGDIADRIRARFAARGFQGPMPESNLRQAHVPRGARVLENLRGSAPGLWLDEGERVVVLLPGPPREMKPMFEALVSAGLRERASGAALARRVIKIAGRIESQTDELLQPLYAEWRAWRTPVAATILAALGQIELHLSARAATADESVGVLAEAVGGAINALGIDVFSTDGRSLEEVVGALLVERRLRVAVAESCTGGLLTSRLTDVPGSSRYVDRAIVAYRNEAKIELLGVPDNLIREHGAVSEPVALSMADGIRSRTNVEVGVGVTGIAGPDGGTPEKPVGTVAIAVVTATSTRSRVFRFVGEREQVKFQASQAALDMVRRLMLEP